MRTRGIAARLIGLLVFALGIAVLVFSFYTAYRMFTAAGDTVSPNSASPTSLGSSVLGAMIKLCALFIMVMVGSVVASRGVQMYFAGDRSEKKE